MRTVPTRRTEDALSRDAFRRRATRAVEQMVQSASLDSLVRAPRPVRLHDPALQAIGVDNAITTGPYEPYGRWADALFAHPDRPDGIAYASRHDPDQLCVALFSRADLTILVAHDPVPLTDRLAELAAILRRYGKGLDPFAPS